MRWNAKLGAGAAMADGDRGGGGGSARVVSATDRTPPVSAESSCGVRELRRVSGLRARGGRGGRT